MLTPERWQIVERIFTEATAVPEEDRAAFLDVACEGDQAVRSEVESLLAADARPFLDASLAGHLAVDWLDDEQGDLKGTAVDQYRILSWLGAGGMGEVYIAEDATLGRRVAVKVLPGAFTADASRLRRFTDEARAASALNHPNIVTVYSVGDVNGRPYIASELVEGETLRARLANGPIPVDEALTIVRQLGSALEAAHAAGIVHRDVKPENVMVRPDGYVKLLDFGVAKLISSDAPPASGWGRTGTGVAVGTLDYMSPEQAAGGDVDGRADLYSLGVMLHEMITGLLPRDSALGSSPGSGTAPAIAPRLKRVLRKLLASAPGARYEAADALLADLQAAQQTLIVRARRRKTLTRSAGAAVVVMGIGMLTWRNPSLRDRLWLGPAAATTASTPTTLAVLPFQTVGLGPEEAYLGVGLADAVITQLGALSEMRVRPTAAVLAFAQPNVDVKAAADKLQVNHVLSALVQRDRDRVRVTVQLVDVRSGSQEWTAQIDEPFTSLFALQDAVSQRVAAALLKRASPAANTPLAGQTVNAEAYRLYLQGRYQFNKSLGPETLRSIESFKAAIARDPRYGLAYAALGHAYRMSASDLLGAEREQQMARARDAAHQALAIDENIGDAYMVLGSIALQHDWDWPAAERSLSRAVELSPNSAEGRRMRGYYLIARSRFDESLAELTLARQLDPTATMIVENRAMALDYSGRSDEALEELAVASTLEPNGPRPQYRRQLILERLGRFPEALAARQQIATLSGAPQDAEALARLSASSGYKAVLDESARKNHERGLPLQATFDDLALGRLEAAVDALEQCERARCSLIPLLTADPWYRPLRNNARFIDLLRRVGL